MIDGDVDIHAARAEWDEIKAAAEAVRIDLSMITNSPVGREFYQSQLQSDCYRLLDRLKALEGE